MPISDPITYYSSRLSHLNGLDKILIKNKKRLALLRLVSFLAAIISFIYLIRFGWVPAISATVLLLTVFGYFVSRDLQNSEMLDHNRLLLKINNDELEFLNHKFSDNPDGAEWQPELHPYAIDLDIFGRASLYQYINRTISERGNKTLVSRLLNPFDKERIPEQQQAVRELSGKTEWRQQLQAYGLQERITIRTEENILSWISEPETFSDKPIWKLTRIVFPVISLMLLLLYIINILNQGQFLFLLVVQLMIAMGISKKVLPAHSRLNKITAELNSFSNSMAWIEKEEFQSKLLQELQDKFGQGNKNASQKIKQLKKILDRLDYKLNPLVYIPLSTFFCWDLQQAFQLEKWKKEKSDETTNWFNSLGEIEAISSIANLHFNHPAWCFPVIRNEAAILDAEEMGHPLIPGNKRVNNSFSSDGTGKITIVTGSNMAGKSTFLRSIGVNIVLAMMGAPVCAKEFSVSEFKVMSSMRVTDNLEENTSTFYAELKKLKHIIESVQTQENIFFLLDEILRGTNSSDRHTGSVALIRQLLKYKTSGIIATHDLGLSELEKDYPDKVSNYHFDVQVENEELFFDYKLKEGVCNSMNASILMKKIGIEI